VLPGLACSIVSGPPDDSILVLRAVTRTFVMGEVVRGLDAGDDVVLAPDADLHDGARVKPRG